MGSDSVEPFLTFENKYVFLLALTSNKGSEDFQELVLDDNSGKLYEKVINMSKTWANNDKIMYVVGAKNTEEIGKIRKLVPNSYLLIPGVGAQGGNLKEICEYGLDKDFKLIVNSSRSIIYASPNDDFAKKASEAAKKIQNEMELIIDKL
jgi:orotidine-5'-phosphate decarboxylase